MEEVPQIKKGKTFEIRKPVSPAKLEGSSVARGRFAQLAFILVERREIVDGRRLSLSTSELRRSIPQFAIALAGLLGVTLHPSRVAQEVKRAQFAPAVAKPSCSAQGGLCTVRRGGHRFVLIGGLRVLQQDLNLQDLFRTRGTTPLIPFGESHQRRIAETLVDR